MSARRASLVDARQAGQCVQAALMALTERRAGADAPVDYARRVRNPWTRDLAVELALEIDRVIPHSVHLVVKGETRSPDRSYGHPNLDDVTEFYLRLVVA